MSKRVRSIAAAKKPSTPFRAVQCRRVRRNDSLKGVGGFTLIELLTVIAIIGILAAIAIPQFSSYKRSAFDAEAQHALRLVATAEEAYFTEYYTYLTCDQLTCATLLPNLEPLGSGVVLQVVGTATEFSGTAFHKQGTQRIFNWN